MCWVFRNALFSKHRFRDNKKLKQGHFEMGIRYANFTPISNHFARRRAPLCPLIKCYTTNLITGLLLVLYVRGHKIGRKPNEIYFC